MLAKGVESVGGLRCAARRRQTRGLTLLKADNKAGYFGVHVSKPGKPNPYQARVRRGGKQVSLGYFATAERRRRCVLHGKDLVHQATDDDGSGEEETAVQATPPAPAPAAAANRGRGTSSKGASAPNRGRDGKGRPAAAAAGQKYPSGWHRQMNFHPECWNNWHFECTVCP